MSYQRDTGVGFGYLNYEDEAMIAAWGCFHPICHPKTKEGFGYGNSRNWGTFCPTEYCCHKLYYTDNGKWLGAPDDLDGVSLKL